MTSFIFDTEVLNTSISEKESDIDQDEDKIALMNEP